MGASRSQVSYLTVSHTVTDRNLSSTIKGVKHEGPTFKGYINIALMSRNACNGENGETGEKSPAAGD